MTALGACDLGTVGSECQVDVPMEVVEVDSPTDADLHATDGSIVVGEQGTVLRRNGDMGWAAVSFPVVADLYGIASHLHEDGSSALMVVGAAGTIAVSEDGGATWRTAEPPTSLDLLAVVRAPEAWIAVGDGVALWSAEGSDWSMAALPRDARLNAVAVSGEQVWAVGDAGALLVSDDAGEHWRSVPSPTSADLFSVTVHQSRTTVVGADDLNP